MGPSQETGLAALSMGGNRGKGEVKTREGSIASQWRRAFLEITNRCNFECLFCPSGISERPKEDMDQALAVDIVDQLGELGFQGTLYLHVLGEPLLHPSAFTIIDHAAETGMRPVIFTNGGALTGDIVQRILSSRAGDLVISMQTINRESYELLRRTPFVWDTYLARIQRALAVADEAESGPRFRVSMGMKKADPEHPEDLYFVEYESREEIREAIASIFAEVERADLAGVFSGLDAHEMADLPTSQVTERLSLSVKPMGNWRRVWRDRPAASGRCPFFGGEVAVLSNGNMTFCHIDYDGRTTIGNVREERIRGMVETPGFVTMARDFMAGRGVARGCECCKGVKPVGDTSGL